MPKILYLPTITFLSFLSRESLKRTFIIEESFISTNHLVGTPSEMAKRIIRLCIASPYSAKTHFGIPISPDEIPRQEQFEIIYDSPGENNVLK